MNKMDTRSAARRLRTWIGTPKGAYNIRKNGQL